VGGKISFFELAFGMKEAPEKRTLVLELNSQLERIVVSSNLSPMYEGEIVRVYSPLVVEMIDGQFVSVKKSLIS